MLLETNSEELVAPFELSHVFTMEYLTTFHYTGRSNTDEYLDFIFMFLFFLSVNNITITYEHTLWHLPASPNMWFSCFPSDQHPCVTSI